MAFTYCTNCGEKIDDSVDKCPHCNHPKGIDRVYGYASESFGKNESTTKSAPENGQNQFDNRDGEQNRFGGQNEQPPYGQNQNQYGQNGQNQYGQGQNPYGQRNPWDNPNIGGQNNPYGQNGQNGQYGQRPWENNRDPYGQNPYGQNQNQYGQNQNPYGQGQFGQSGGPYGQNGGYGAPWQPPQKKKMSTGLMVFSIINILLGACCSGSIFGIIALVFTVMARDAKSEAEEIRRKKIALAMNIIAVVLTVASIISFSVTFFAGGGFEALKEAINGATTAFIKFK